MGISIEELRKLEKDSYQILDIRNETEISHGAIPGAIAVAEDAIDGHPEVDFTKKLVICCSRGEHSVEVAEALEEKGAAYLLINVLILSSVSSFTARTFISTLSFNPLSRSFVVSEIS